MAPSGYRAFTRARYVLSFFLLLQLLFQLLLQLLLLLLPLLLYLFLLHFFKLFFFSLFLASIPAAHARMKIGDSVEPVPLSWTSTLPSHVLAELAVGHRALVVLNA